MESSAEAANADLVGGAWAGGVEPDIRPVMAGFPTGVAVITALGESRSPWGITCTSLCSVSLRPPILLACIRCESPTLSAMLDSGRFAVNLLHSGAQFAAELFASGARDRFDRIAWDMAEEFGGPHLGEAAHAIADCAVVASTTIGDHTVVTGRLYNASVAQQPRPLLYGLRRYASWSKESSSCVERPW